MRDEENKKEEYMRAPIKYICNSIRDTMTKYQFPLILRMKKRINFLFFVFRSFQDSDILFFRKNNIAFKEMKIIKWHSVETHTRKNLCFS